MTTSRPLAVAVSAPHPHVVRQVATLGHSVQMFNKYGLAIAAVALTAAAILWAYEKFPRISAWLFFIAAAAATVGATIWLDAMAGLTANLAGVTVLAVVILISGAGFLFEAVRKHKYHRIRTPIICGVAGIAGVLTVGSFTHMVTAATVSAGKTSQALAQSAADISTGRAAHVVAPHQQAIITALGFVVIIVLAVIAVMFEKGGKKGRRGAAFTAAGGGTPTRRALPPGRAGVRR